MATMGGVDKEKSLKAAMPRCSPWLFPLQGATVGIFLASLSLNFLFNKMAKVFLYSYMVSGIFQG